MSSLTADFEFVFLSSSLSSSSSFGSFLMLVSIPTVDHCIALPSSAVKFPWRNNFENMHTYFAQFHKHGCHDLIGFLFNESGAFRTLALGTKDFGWNYYQRLFRLCCDCIVSIFNSPKPINDHRYCVNKSPPDICCHCLENGQRKYMMKKWCKCETCCISNSILRIGFCSGNQSLASCHINSKSCYVPKLPQSFTCFREMNTSFTGKWNHNTISVCIFNRKHSPSVSSDLWIYLNLG